ncbi:hypothetical protein JHK86_027689 [Glycine max]|nr:hypothetical protein JHK86_027689 [Glycine max]
MDEPDASFPALFRCWNEEIEHDLFRGSEIRFLAAEVVRDEARQSSITEINQQSTQTKQTNTKTVSEFSSLNS